MSYVQIPNLPAAVTMNGTELLEAVQSGVSVRVTSSQLAVLANASIAIGTNVVIGGAPGDILYVGAGGVLSQYTPYQLINALAASLPTANPHVVGQCWLNGEVISVSQG